MDTQQPIQHTIWQLKMKNKTKTYILIIVVLSIWGAIAFQFSSIFKPDNHNTFTQLPTVQFNPKPIKIRDTFFIPLINRDPFLGTLQFNTKRKKRIKKKHATERPLVSNYKIRYHGSIKKKKSNEKVFVVSVDNEQYLLKKGQQVKNITLLKGNASEIVIKLNNKLKKIALD